MFWDTIWVPLIVIPDSMLDDYKRLARVFSYARG
jgi:hypothetical protein